MADFVFDVDDFLTWYPQFEGIPREMIETYGCAAVAWISGGTYSFTKECIVKTLVYLIVCHLLALYQRGPNGPVGPVNSAREGSVSAGYGTLSGSGGSNSFWETTPCGLAALDLLRLYGSGGIYYTGCFDP